jgi:DNA-binding MarR family transcriptional regulator
MSARLRRRALELLSENPLTLKELTEALEISEKRAFRVLRHLFEKGLIDSYKDEEGRRRYRASSTESTTL